MVQSQKGGICLFFLPFFRGKFVSFPLNQTLLDSLQNDVVRLLFAFQEKKTQKKLMLICKWACGKVRLMGWPFEPNRSNYCITFVQFEVAESRLLKEFSQCDGGVAGW